MKKVSDWRQEYTDRFMNSAYNQNEPIEFIEELLKQYAKYVEKSSSTLWSLAIAHLPKKDRDKVIQTYKQLNYLNKR